MRFSSISNDFFKQLEKKGKNARGLDKFFVKHPFWFFGGLVLLLTVECIFLFWVL